MGRGYELFPVSTSAKTRSLSMPTGTLETRLSLGTCSAAVPCRSCSTKADPTPTIAYSNATRSMELPEAESRDLAQFNFVINELRV